MTAVFDPYSESYREVVQRSIAFAGIGHDVFLRAKAWLLADVFARHFGGVRPHLLDVGCGIGLMHDVLKPITAGLAGCDPSRDCVASAALRHPDVAYREQRDGALPWPDRSFDATLAVCVFHHVPPPERARLVAEMTRVTRPGGLAIAIEHNPLNPLTRLAVARCPFDEGVDLLPAGEARTLLREGGLRDVESRFFLLLPAAGRRVGALERPFRRLPLGAQYAAIGRV